MNSIYSKFDSKKLRDLLTIFLIIIISASCVISYLYQFGSFQYSSDHNDWGAFGNFFTLFVGIINLIILYRISNIANEIQKGSIDKQLKAEIYKQ